MDCTISKTSSGLKVLLPDDAGLSDIRKVFTTILPAQRGSKGVNLLLVEEDSSWTPSQEDGQEVMALLEKAVAAGHCIRIAWVTGRDLVYCMGLMIQVTSQPLKERFSVFDNEPDAEEWLGDDTADQLDQAG